MSNKEKEMKKLPQVTNLAGFTVDVLLDLGNCFSLTSGHNKLSKENIQNYLDKCQANINKFPKDSQSIYDRDVRLVRMAYHTFPSDSVAFGELCRAFFKLKFNTLCSPSLEEKFLNCTTRRFGESAVSKIEEIDSKWLTLLHERVKESQV